MKTFEWHGIPVNLLDTKAEWRVLGIILGLEAVLAYGVFLILLASK
jgi:hypothetical protein